MAERKFFRFTDGGKPRVSNHEGTKYVVDMFHSNRRLLWEKCQATALIYGKPWRDHCAQSLPMRMLPPKNNHVAQKSESAVLVVEIA